MERRRAQNSILSSLLEQPSTRPELGDEVGRRLRGPLIEVDGLTIFADVTADQLERARAGSQDRTAVEAWVNGLHLDGHEDPSTAVDFAHQLVAAVDMLVETLVGHGSDGTFQITGSVNDGEFLSAVIRFFRLRSDEPPWVAEVDAYTEAVLVETIVIEADDVAGLA